MHCSFGVTEPRIKSIILLENNPRSGDFCCSVTNTRTFILGQTIGSPTPAACLLPVTCQYMNRPSPEDFFRLYRGLYRDFTSPVLNSKFLLFHLSHKAQICKSTLRKQSSGDHFSLPYCLVLSLWSNRVNVTTFKKLCFVSYLFFL